MNSGNFHDNLQHIWGGIKLANWKKKFLATGFAGGIVLAGLTGCAEGENQDTGVDDGEETEENINEEEE